jgi:hypothetical protein
MSRSEITVQEQTIIVVHPRARFLQGRACLKYGKSVSTFEAPTTYVKG